jgi:hypothetical protein
MDETMMHPMPSWAVPARRQFLLLLSSGRAWLLLAASVVPVLVLEALRLRQLATRPLSLDQVFPVLLFVLPFFLFIAPAWALLTWRSEARDERDYHWSLPVPQAIHDAWRVLAGAVWLVAATALCCLTGLLLALRAGQVEMLAYGPLFWLNFFTYPLAFYLAASILPLVTRRPVEWMIGCVLVGAILLFLAEGIGVPPLQAVVGAVLDGRAGLHAAMDAGFVAESISIGGSEPINLSGYHHTLADWALATTLWLGIPLVGVVLAVRSLR